MIGYLSSCDGCLAEGYAFKARTQTKKGFMERREHFDLFLEGNRKPLEL